MKAPDASGAAAPRQPTFGEGNCKAEDEPSSSAAGLSASAESRPEDTGKVSMAYVHGWLSCWFPHVYTTWPCLLQRPDELFLGSLEQLSLQDMLIFGI